MPRSVKVSALLYIGSFVAGLVSNAFTMRWERFADPKMLAAFLIGFVVFFGPFVWLFYMTFRGYNWARIAFTITTSLLIFPYIKKSLATLETSSIGYFYLVQAAASIVIMTLLYLPSSNRWFHFCKLHRKSLVP